MSEPSDHELMQQIAGGRPERLALLYDRYQRRLYTLFLRLGFAPAASEDLVQDSFLRVLRLAGSYRGDGHFVGWLFRLARNVAADAWQRQSLWQPLEEEQEAALAADDEHEPAALQEQAMLERRLRRALLKLSRENRELVLLGRLRELGSDELAALFGCSTGAVKVRLHRALLELRRHFDDIPDHVVEETKS